MNLREAFRVIKNTSSHSVVSTPALARAVNQMSAHGNLVEAPDLDTTFTMRPLDVLLALATATRALVEEDVLIEYQSWAKWRYLGVFDGAIRHMPISLSVAGESIRGNQRRVMSEELGIGFSVKIAERWMNPLSDPRQIVRTVDVDSALDDSAVISGLIGTHVFIDSVPNRRPDFFVVADDRSSLARFRIATLESKGTSAQKNWAQLSSANQQLQGITLNGAVLPGLAVGTMLNHTGVSSNALQLPNGLGNSESFENATVEIDLDSLDFQRTLKSERRREQTATETLIEGVLSASWANLGQASGNEEVFDTWASLQAKERRRSNQTNGSTSSRMTRDGATYVGTQLQLAVRGGRLTVFTGIERELEEALRTGRAERILSLQRSEKHRTQDSDLSQNQQDNSDEPILEAISPDGEIVILEATFTE
jgi:hypothetical protein